MAKDDIAKIVDERLAQRGVAPLRDAGVSGAPARNTAPALSGRDPVSASTEFLSKLEALMADYKPDLPVVEDKTDVLRCVTSDGAKTNADVGKAVAALKGQTESARKERRRREREFYDTAYPLAFHLDYDWPARKGKPVPPQYGCLNESTGRWTSITDPDFCKNNPYSSSYSFNWRVRIPGRPALFLYSNAEVPPTQPPELMRRMDAAGITPPARLSCRVSDVVGQQDHKVIECRAAGVAAVIRVTGSLGPVSVGDVVSVPLASVKRDPEGVLFKNVGAKSGPWTVDADADVLTVDTAATCPSVEEILAAIGDAGGRP
jgi:hypothetical protein